MFPAAAGGATRAAARPHGAARRQPFGHRARRPQRRRAAVAVRTLRCRATRAVQRRRVRQRLRQPRATRGPRPRTVRRRPTSAARAPSGFAARWRCHTWTRFHQCRRRSRRRRFRLPLRKSNEEQQHCPCQRGCRREIKTCPRHLLVDVTCHGYTHHYRDSFSTLHETCTFRK